MKPITILVALAYLAAPAHADDAPVFGPPERPTDPGPPADPGPPVIETRPAPRIDTPEEAPRDFAASPTIYLDLGGEALVANNGVSTDAVRIHGGLTQAFGGGSVRPFIGAGGTFAGGELHKDDMRALDGTLSLGYLEYGPEAMVGLRFVDGGYADTRIFASAAYLFTSIDQRIAIDAVAGVGNTSHGFRAALGANWADKLGALSMRDRQIGWMIFLVPQQIELDYETSLGTTRYGVTLSYGI